MQGIYLYSEGIDIANMSGVIRKINSQVKSLNTNGLNCKLYKFKTFYNRLNLFYKPKDRYKYFDIRNISVNKLKYIYIRKPGTIDFFFIRMLATIKKINKDIKIVLELPTYPYDLEFEKNVSGFVKLNIEKLYRRFLYRYVDRIAIISNDKYIFNIPTIEIDNGIDFEKYLVRDTNSLDISKINLCAVAKFYGSHGYERLFKGLYNYYSNNPKFKVYLHMVGDGPEIEKYKSIVKNLSICEFVKFYGFLNGEELRSVYGFCDASIGSLGAYTKGVYDTHELKSTEALAYGIPFICGCKSSRLTDKGYKYFLELPNNETDIDVYTIINFINRLYDNENISTITNNIRLFGEKYFNMDECMKKVVNYFQS